MPNQTGFEDIGNVLSDRGPLRRVGCLGYSGEAGSVLSLTGAGERLSGVMQANRLVRPGTGIWPGF